MITPEDLKMMKIQMGQKDNQVDRSTAAAIAAAKKATVSQDDFLFGAQSALAYEEFNVIKTNKFNQKQKKVLVIDGTSIYHQKQLVDPKTGEPRAV